MEKKQINRKAIIGTIVLVLLMAVLAFTYQKLKPQSEVGAKAVEVIVVSGDKSEKRYQVQTDAEYLEQVMDEAEGLEYTGSEGPYGMVVESVNGETAKFEENQAYWGFFVNGEYCNHGISEQPVADGDEFKIVYTAE